MSENRAAAEIPARCPDCAAKTTPGLTWCPQCYRDLLPEPTLPTPRPSDAIEPAQVSPERTPADTAAASTATAGRPRADVTGDGDGPRLAGGELDDAAAQQVDQLMAQLAVSESTGRRVPASRMGQVKLAAAVGIGLTVVLLLVAFVVGLLLR